MSQLWPEARSELLKELWAKGLTASQIARRIGEGITRSAVLGRAHRLDLATRSKAAATRNGRVSKNRMFTKRNPNFKFGGSSLSRRPAPGTQPSPASNAVPYGEAPVPPFHQINPRKHIAFMQLRPWHCRFPLPDGTYCGLRRIKGSPYCEEHDRLTHLPRRW